MTGSEVVQLEHAEAAEESPEGLLADYTSPAENAPVDIIGGHYRLLPNQPLPALSRTLSQACEAQDTEAHTKPLYALILDNTMPYRMKGIEAQKAATQSALLKCYAAGPTPLSSPAETRMVVVLEKPLGKPLHELVQESGPLPERFVMDRILRPLTDALKELAKAKINHGCINPTQLFFDQELKIAESISEPSGYSQDFHYESPERLLADPSGKGSGDASADIYAIGMLALFLTAGELPLQHLSKKEWEEAILRQGSYHALTQNLDPSETINDLLRGVLNDNPLERWGFEQISSWLDGKRFNLIMPSVPRDSTRPFAFNESEYFNYRALAHTLYHNWQTARIHLSANRLVRWMELNQNKAAAADTMAKILRVTDSDENEIPLTDEELMRVIAILDPYGPMRYKETSVNIDGLGKTLAEAYRHNNLPLRQQLMVIIDSGLPTFISDLLERSTSNALAGNTLWQLQKLRPVLTLKGLGFGIERLLYGLNPSLTCQSSLLKKYHPTSLQDVLHILDRLAKTSIQRHSLIDNHLAAFLTSKLEIIKDVRIMELAAHPDLLTDSRLIMLKLLAQAQQKIGNPPLKGLAAWAASTVMPIADKLKQKSNRELLKKEITKAAKTGLLGTLAFLLFKDAVFSLDRQEYTRAKHLYQYHYDSVVYLKDAKKLHRSATEIGRRLSVTIGFLALLLTLYYSLSPYVSF